MSLDVLYTNFRDLRRWAEEGSLWSMGLSLSCCSLEFHGVFSPRYDWQRFGSSVRTEPEQADVLLVMGPITSASANEIKKIYEKMPTPKYVISVGSCANTGGLFAVENNQVCPGLDSIIPVDVYVPGCPPRPESLIHALMRLQEKVANEQRV